MRYLFIFILALTSNSIASPRTFILDTSASEIIWTGKKVTAAHTGTVKIKEGKFKLTGNDISEAIFHIDMTSIKNNDISDPKYNKKLVDHLVSSDFFSATDFPEATFTINQAKFIPNTPDGQPNYSIAGKLSIKGIENDVSFPAIVSINNNEAKASGTVTLDRTKWNIRYGSGKFFESLGDKLILDDFTVELKLVAKA